MSEKTDGEKRKRVVYSKKKKPTQQQQQQQQQTGTIYTNNLYRIGHKNFKVRDAHKEIKKFCAFPDNDHTVNLFWKIYTIVYCSIELPVHCI